MDATELARAVRRRWAVAVVTVVVALGAALATILVVPAGPPVRRYGATAVLLAAEGSTEGSYGAGSYNMSTLAGLATVGDVPRRVAEVLAAPDPVEMSRKVRAFGDENTGFLRITAKSTDPEEARVLADTYATELVVFIDTRLAETNAREADALKGQIDALKAQVADLDRQIDLQDGIDNDNPPANLVAERDAKVAQYTLLFQRYQELIGASGGSGLQIVQNATPRVLPEEGFVQVRSWPGRVIIGVVLGLLAGLGIVLLLERFDTRIHTKERAEQVFDLPVLAEVPLVRKWKRGKPGVTVATQPRSPAADAFRLLAAAIMRRPPEPPRCILVTGPGPEEGKTTVVANLAGNFAEVGKKVLVLSADLHRPRIHTLFGIPNMSGLTEALEDESGNSSILDSSRWRTALANVRVVPSGGPADSTDKLLSSPNMRRIIAEAREVADVVLIDTPPILASSDAAHLFPHVDVVLLVARAGRTTTQAAQRTTELLRRLGAPVVGAVLNAVTEAALPRGYYNYYASSQSRKGGRRRPARPSGRRVRTGL
ncbi:MAG: polysaccharide biosynthesis tyrosine autokinase [Actinomycetota bacterium]